MNSCNTDRFLATTVVCGLSTLNTFNKNLMFLVSKVSACFSLSRTSLSYIIGEGYAPCFETVIIVDVKKSYVPFTMNFDEKPLHAKSKWT